MITFPHKKWNFFLQLDLHDGYFLNLPVPLAITKAAGAHIGGGLLAFPFWGMGSEDTMNDCKLLADGMEVVSRGHDSQVLILPHLNIAPPPVCPNLLIPLLILGSSSKCFMASTSVVGKSGPIAVSIGAWVGINSSCCDPAPLPTSLVGNWGTVLIGFTIGDLIASLLIYYWDFLKAIIVDEIVSFFTDIFTDAFTDFFDQYLDDFLEWFDDIEDYLPDSLDFMKGAVDAAEDKLENLIEWAFSKEVLTEAGESVVATEVFEHIMSDKMTSDLMEGEAPGQGLNGLDNAVSSSAESVGSWVDSMVEKIL